jgi:hypothetical protein
MFEQLRRATEAGVFEGPGHTSSELRQALGRGEAPEELQALVAKIRDEAWTITDQDWASARACYDQEQLFEIVVASAYGAARDRLRAALEAVEQA